MSKIIIATCVIGRELQSKNRRTYYANKEKTINYQKDKTVLCPKPEEYGPIL